MPRLHATKKYNQLIKRLKNQKRFNIYDFKLVFTGEMIYPTPTQKEEKNQTNWRWNIWQRNLISVPLHLPWLLPSLNQQSWEHQDVSVTCRKNRFLQICTVHHLLPHRCNNPIFHHCLCTSPHFTIHFVLPRDPMQSTGLVTPSHIPAFLLQCLQPPKYLQLLLLSFMD